MHTILLDSSFSNLYEEDSSSLSDDLLLVHLASFNSTRALEQLYHRYKQKMFAVAYRVLSDSYLAEDVVQEVFLTLWQRASLYHKEMGEVKSWLLTIVRNRAIDKVRSLVSRESSFAHLGDDQAVDVLSRDPEVWAQVWQDERADVLRQALAQLPPEQREVIELNFFADYPHAEIARQLQLPLGTVKGRLRLGLQKIRQLVLASGIDSYA